MINSFPGYEFKRLEDGKWHNIFRGTDVGFGGYVYAEPGMYYNVALLDVGNMHGASIVNLNKFGEDTQKYIEIRNARMLIKQGIKTGDFTEAKKIFGGKFAPYLNSVEEADALQNALKLILNSTYGIAAATFANPLKDQRDKNNIIALRGALFMRTLQDEVTARGFQVCHIKTDSIKIPNATEEIIEFVIKFGEQYGYEFEHEATYDRICLVNDAVYIAKYDEKGVRNKGGKHANEWTATGTQFAVPYIFKTLFTKEPIEFEDLCETKSVTSGSLYLDMNESLPDVTIYEKEMDIRMHNSRLKEDERPKRTNPELERYSDEKLLELISEGHSYQFVGKTGLFTPIKEGCGGGILYREKDGKYYAASGTKDYRWLESEIVKSLGKDGDIDISYYETLKQEAIETIEKFGSYENFYNR